MLIYNDGKTEVYDDFIGVEIRASGDREDIHPQHLTQKIIRLGVYHHLSFYGKWRYKEALFGRLQGFESNPDNYLFSLVEKQSKKEDRVINGKVIMQFVGLQVCSVNDRSKSDLGIAFKFLIKCEEGYWTPTAIVAVSENYLTPGDAYMALAKILRILDYTGHIKKYVYSPFGDGLQFVGNCIPLDDINMHTLSANLKFNQYLHRYEIDSSTLQRVEWESSIFKTVTYFDYCLNAPHSFTLANRSASDGTTIFFSDKGYTPHPYHPGS